MERDHGQVVLDGGCESFAQFVQQFVLPARYEAFKAGVEKIGIEAALECGSDATITAAHIKNEPAAYVAAVRAWSDDHRGVVPTRQTAYKLLHQVDPRREVPQSVQRMDLLAQLRAENENLRAENAMLKKQLAAYEGKADTSKKKKAA